MTARLLASVFILIAVPIVLVTGAALRAQAIVTDADLERASDGRVVKLGAVATGRVTTVPLEVYVARVIAGEAEPNAPESAKQAVAIAIRTFATVNARRHARASFDLCDGTHCQVPRTATAATRQATLATAGQVLVYNGAAAEVFYSANCGGQTEAAAEVWPRALYPYLQSVPDDVHEDDQPWTLERTLSQLQQALAGAGVTGRLSGVDVAARNHSGRVSLLRLHGMRPETIGGDAFRAALGTTSLRSTAFAIDTAGDRFRFTGRGYGHGVGMCVVGAARRARRGETAGEILAAYYPGLDLVPLRTLGRTAD